MRVNWGWERLWRSKTVPRSSWFGPFFVLSFGIPFLVVLGSFWGRFGALRGSFWCFFGSSTHRFNPSTHQLVDSTHQLINLSTHHPMALRHFLTRPGGLRAARLNKLITTCIKHKKTRVLYSRPQGFFACSLGIVRRTGTVIQCQLGVCEPP